MYIKQFSATLSLQFKLKGIKEWLQSEISTQYAKGKICWVQNLDLWLLKIADMSPVWSFSVAKVHCFGINRLCDSNMDMLCYWNLK